MLLYQIYLHWYSYFKGKYLFKRDKCIYITCENNSKYNVLAVHRQWDNSHPNMFNCDSFYTTVPRALCVQTRRSAVTMVADIGHLPMSLSRPRKRDSVTKRTTERQCYKTLYMRQSAAHDSATKGCKCDKPLHTTVRQNAARWHCRAFCRTGGREKATVQDVLYQPP